MFAASLILSINTSSVTVRLLSTNLIRVHLVLLAKPPTSALHFRCSQREMRSDSSSLNSSLLILSLCPSMAHFGF